MNKNLFALCILITGSLAFAQSAPLEGAATTSKAQIGATPGAGSVNAPAAATIKPVPKKWSTSAYVGNWGDIGTITDSKAPKNETFTDVYLEPKRDIGKGQFLALRINGQMYQRGDSTSDKMVMGDPQLIYRNKNAFGSSVRLSAPVLKQSRITGRHELRYNGGTNLYTSGRFSVDLSLEGRAYGYTLDKDGQLMARTRNGVAFGYAVNDRITPYFNALYDVRWNNDGEGTKTSNVDEIANPANLVRKHWFDLGSSFVLAPKLLTLDLYVTQIRDYNANTTFLDKEDTGYNIELSATF